MGNVSVFSLVFHLASETSSQSFGASAAIPSHPKEGSVIEYFAGENLDLIRFCDCDLNTIFTSFYKEFFRIRLFYWLVTEELIDTYFVRRVGPKRLRRNAEVICLLN